MGLFDKLKNIFTEEVEEQPIKKEVRQVEIPGPKEMEEELIKESEIKKDEKFVFPVYFDDSDFDELKPKKVEIKKEVPSKEIYGGKVKEVKSEKKFQPSPVISPVYGILDKNYNKEDVIDHSKTTRSDCYKPHKNVTVDDVRKKAFGTLEDDLEKSLFKDDPIYTEKEEYLITSDETALTSSPVDFIEEELVKNYKREVKNDLNENMTLEVLNNLEDKEDKEDKEDINLSESDLFNLIDSMYEKDDEDGNH
ncbi:MAG: hypothetical protein RR325_00730 [Bacilli bacterium]